jgi:uncharacterized protein (DUF433 family)
MNTKRKPGEKAKAARRNVKRCGRYIVADAAIRHGALTFRGTRIFVSDVFEQVAEGMSWDQIMLEWRGSVTKPAIADAIRLARDVLLHGTAPSKRKPAA